MFVGKPEAVASVPLRTDPPLFVLFGWSPRLHHGRGGGGFHQEVWSFLQLTLHRLTSDSGIPDTAEFRGWIAVMCMAVPMLDAAFQIFNVFPARVLSPSSFRPVIFPSLCPAGCAAVAGDWLQQESGQTHCLALTLPLLIVKRGSGIPELSGCDFKALSWEL